MSLFKLGTVDLTYVKVKINISIEFICFYNRISSVVISDPNIFNVYICLSAL